jgi:hypothetical protein
MGFGFPVADDAASPALLSAEPLDAWVVGDVVATGSRGELVFLLGVIVEAVEDDVVAECWDVASPALGGSPA